MTELLQAAAVYARLSLSTEESVSIERQIEACTAWAESRRYRVVLTATDDNVRASKIRPDDRPGWRQIMEADIDLVVIWKLDRLTRSVRDFVAVTDWATAHNVQLATTDGEVDMSTGMGEAFAYVSAVFARLEARSIGERATAARKTIVVDQGRRAGGVRPWPFTTAPNPNGDGLVLRPIPERADTIRWCARQILDNDASLNGLCRALDERGMAPQSRRDRQDTRWHVSPLKRLLLNPALMGAATYHGQPVRNDDGTIRIDPDQAILDPGTFAALTQKLSGRVKGTRPPIDALLSGGLLQCGTCGHAMNPRQASASYVCSKAHCTKPAGMRIAIANEIYVSEWLQWWGNLGVSATPDTRPDPQELAELREALNAVRTELGTFPDADRYAVLSERGRALQQRIADKTAPQPTGPIVFTTDGTWGQRYQAAESDRERRRILFEFDAPITILPGVRGGRRDPLERFQFEDWERAATGNY